MIQAEFGYSELPFSRSTIERLAISDSHAPATSFQMEISFAQDNNGHIERLLLGFDRDYENTNLLITGTVGSGMTSLLQTIVFGASLNYLVDELQIWVDSCRGQEYEYLKSINSTMIFPCADSSFGKASDFLNKLSEEVDRRFYILQAVKETIFSYWKQMVERNYEILPRILFVADDPEGLNHYDYCAKLERISRFGRGVGINCIVATKNPSNISAGYFRMRLALRCYPDILKQVLEHFGPADAVEEAVAASQTLSTGEFYLSHNGGDYWYFKKTDCY